MTETIDRDDLAALVARSNRIVGFTGAGISTECGVPDFRSPDSPWRRNAPIPFADFCKDPAMRAEAWRRKFAMDDLYAGACPGQGHAFFADLAREGKLVALITQNIDALHHASGLDRDLIIELHGNGTYATCLDCGRRHELPAVRAFLADTGSAPTCPCGGIVKSATISFGQSLPADALQRACDVAGSCDLFLVVGSSLVVRPAADLPRLAKQSGATLAIVNREATPLDPIADVIVRGEIGDILGSLRQAAAPV